MRVLYVDDDRINTLLFVETCRLGASIDVDTASSGDEALQSVREQRPDLLVLDLHMPDTNGYDLLRALRTEMGDPPVPAILCTADDAPLVQQPAREAGFMAVWTKPVELRRVLDELARHAGRGAV
jgi:CheY-like chemotaxis protein